MKKGIYTHTNGRQYRICEYTKDLYIINDVINDRTYIIDSAEVDISRIEWQEGDSE